MPRQYFGTDGIRGKVGFSNVNPEFFLKLGWAVGTVLKNGHTPSVLIGKDTRISGYMLESALESGFAASGVDTRLLGPMPTPGIAYLTQTFRASVGVVVSASHNPFEDNGIKFFQQDGTKLPDDIELAIEEKMNVPMTMVAPEKLGKAKRINDAAGRYIEFCKSTIPSMMRLNGMKIVIDCANGATYHIAPYVFEELGATVIALGIKPDGLNINKDCGTTHPETLKATVLREGADLGIAFDGDGDRVIMVDSQGRVINGDQILYIITYDRYIGGRLQGGVVGTLMTNVAVEHALKQLSIPLIRTNVGDRYVMEALKDADYKIGGEPSGHVVCLDKTSTGDGIIASLQVLAAMIKQQRSLDALADDIPLMPQVLMNVSTPHAKAILKQDEAKTLILDMERSLDKSSRLLIRASGTEPLIRLMFEGDNPTLLEEKALTLKSALEKLGERI
jgi:phosphoglucosamine mutase